jgi:CheY-like chemotaxis protein
MHTMPNIVVIDDDDLMRGLLKEWLEAAGYRVREQALSTACKADTTDLLIVDLYMPRQTGREFVQRIRARCPSTPVIAISAQFRPGLHASACAAEALGVNRLLAKPCTRKDLLDAVRAVIGAAR